MNLYSSTAPKGWNALPTPTKEQFHSIASKGDWTAQEAYDHLVPDTLKDNPEEVKAWMDGNPDIGVPDRDVSRIVSGANGGEYSPDNTAMEVSSVNRARGSADMTAMEIEERDSRNAIDIQAIEDHYTGDEVSEMDSSALIDTTAAVGTAGTLVADAAELAVDGILPVMAGLYVGAKLVDADLPLTDTQKKVAVVGGSVGTFLLACTPPGQLAMGGWFTYKAIRFGINCARKMAQA